MKNIFHGSTTSRETEWINNRAASSSIYALSESTSSQTIYNSYYNNLNYVISMEAVTLCAAFPKNQKTREEYAETKNSPPGKRDISILTSSAVDIARSLKASAIITFSEELPKTPPDIPLLVFKPRKSTMINELTQGIEENETDFYAKVETRARSASKDLGDASVIAYINNLIESGGVVVGIIRMNDSDAIVVYDLSKNIMMKKLRECTERVDADVLRAVLNIALELANQGREGKSCGTAFIIGDSNEVLRRSHPLVLNPFEGQNRENCSIVKPESWETVKSFAQLDGVFVLTGKGMIRAAGRYLDIDARDVPVEQGLGGRHTSAAAITRDTETIAVTVSTSGGTIRIFKDGLELLKIEPDITMVH